MRINDDFSRSVMVHGSTRKWEPSPAPGVERRKLFRIGDEKARATSIVRYAPGSSFAPHEHGGGEEFLVLDGVFQDGQGDYPAGTYVRNPPGSSHAPAAEEGAMIFVRLWQFRTDDAEQVVRMPGEGAVVTPRKGGASARILFEDGHEQVRLEEWNAGEDIHVENTEGLEVLVVSGQITVDGQELVSQGWIRLPPGEDLNASVSKDGAGVWMKMAPLLHEEVCSFR